MSFCLSIPSPKGRGRRERCGVAHGERRVEVVDFLLVFLLVVYRVVPQSVSFTRVSFCLSIPSPKRHTQHQSLSRRAHRWRPIGKKRRRLLRATTTTWARRRRRRVPTRSSGTRNPARFRRAKTSSARPSTRGGRPKALQILSAIFVVVVIMIQVATMTTTRVSPRIIRLNSSSRRSSTATEAKSARNFARKKRSNVS